MKLSLRAFSSLVHEKLILLSLVSLIITSHLQDFP